jgi:hypothetical protein
MRFRSTTAVCALLAALAIAAIAAASASATTPEFAKPYPNKIEVKGASVALETVKGKMTVICYPGTNKASGEITGATTATLTFTFTGCTGGLFGPSCSSEGAKAGEIKTALLEASPYSVNGGKNVGLVISRKGAGNFAEFSCGTGESKENVKVRGSLIGVLSPPNFSTKEFQLAFNASKGVQKPDEYMNAKGETVKGTLEAEESGKTTYAFEQAGLTGESETQHDELLSSEATKVSAQIPGRGLPEFGPELLERSHSPFEGTAFSPIFELTDGGTWSASSATIKGSIIDPNEVALTIAFEGMGERSGCGFKTTTTLIGRLGYLNKTSKEVGLLLEPMGSRVAKCESSIIGAGELTGSVLGKITPVNTLSKTLTLAFKQTKGVQEFEKFEGESVLHHLQLSKESVGLLANFELGKFNEQVKIEA